MNRQLERGQGTIEYSLMLALIGIVALAVITILVNPQDFRNGIIYQGIYRPVQCAVQGIEPEDCADTAGFSAVRFPSVGSGNSRKLCSDGTYISQGDIDAAGGDVGLACLTGGGGTSVQVAPEIFLINILGDGDLTDFNRLGNGDNVATADNMIEGDYEFIVVGNDEDFHSTSVQSIKFELTRGGTSVKESVDNLATDEVDYTLGNPDYTDLVNLTPGDYTLRATPYTLDDELGDVGAAFTITFTVLPQPTVPLSIAGVYFRDPATGERGNQIQQSVVYDEGTYGIEVDARGDYSRIVWTLTTPNGATQANQTGTLRPDDVGVGYIYGLNPDGTVIGKLFDAGTSNIGTYILTGRGFDPDGNVVDLNGAAGGNDISVTFNIEAANPDFKISQFRLVDANLDTDKDIDPNDGTFSAIVEDGATIELRPTEDFVTFVADVPNGPTTSVILRLNGPVSANQTEGAAPYTLHGDNSGDYEGTFLQPGSYTLSATPRDASNVEGPTKTVTFTVVEPPAVVGAQVVNFSLFDTDSQQIVRGFSDGDVVDLGEVTYNWRFRHETDPGSDSIGRVEYQLTGGSPPSHTEGFSPYDFPNSSGPLNLTAGDYTLSVTPVDTDGNDGVTKVINFSVVEPFSCDTPNVQIVELTCNPTQVNLELTSSCGSDTVATIQNSEIFQTLSTSDGGSGQIHRYEWVGTTDVDTGVGEYESVCTDGEWDPTTLTMSFGGNSSGAFDQLFTIDFTDGTLTPQ